MIKYEEVPALAKSLIVCDVCGKEFDVDSNDLEAQEFLRIVAQFLIEFIGGYASVFGDESHIQCDICQHCLLKMIKDYMRRIGD